MLLTDVEKSAILLRRELSQLELSKKISEKKAIELIDKLHEIEKIIVGSNND